MSFVTNLTTAFTRVGTEFKAIRTLISGSGTGNISGLTTTDKTSLVAAINEVKAAVGAGSPTTIDDLTDVTITTASVGQMLRNNGSGQWVNVDPTTYLQPLDSDLTSIAALTTTSFGRALLALADAAALAGQVAPGSLTVAGVLEVATQAEVDTGSDTTRTVSPATLASRLSAFAQPLDSDLTAIAALSTTSFGRGLLALADAAALTASLNTGTTALKGALLLATTGELQTGTDTAKAATAAGVKAAIDQRIDNGALGTSTTNAPSAQAVKTYADGLIAANDAMVFKGVIDASANPNYPASNRGDTYRVSVAGKIGGASGVNVTNGDLLIAMTDGTAAGNQATVGAQWEIVEGNLDGAVTGPASAVSANLASFSGTSGKVVQDSGFTPSNGAIGAGSATVLPTSAQIVAYAQPIDADLTAIAALSSAADKVPYSTGAQTWSLFTATSFGRGLVGVADAATARGAGQLNVWSQTEVGDVTRDFTADFVAALA